MGWKLAKKPLLALILLVLAGLACYSDSPLWPYELTPAPPTATPFPTPLPSQTRFQIGDLAWAPTSVSEAAFRLDLTRFPEPLKADLSNRSPKSCSQNTLLRVLYNAVALDGTIYLLVDCNGAVGWTREDKVLGPITLVVGDRALTTEGGLDESGAYKIESSDPPYREDDPFRQQFDCKLEDTVDVVAMAGFSTGELYYKIRCKNPLNPVVPNVGWTTAEALFGPVRFRNGEIGIVPQEFETIALTESPGSEETTAICQQGERVTITQTPVQRQDNELYYEVECAAGTGWVDQALLVGPVPFEVGEQVLVTAPGVTNSAETRQAAADSQQATVEVSILSGVAEEEAAPPLPNESLTIPTVPLTPTAGPFLGDNQIGQCLDATLTTISDFAGTEGRLYAQVECAGVIGWLESSVLYGPVLYEIGDTVLLGEKALLGFNQRGIYLAVNLFDIEGPSGGAEVIAGECAFDFDTLAPIEAQVVDVGYYRDSLGNVVGVFYRASCTDKNGVTIEGWINQDRIGE